METDSVRYLFADASLFLHRAITIFMDESHGKENLMRYFKLLNVATPFLILNDFRVSK
jgi:hypothetical protein